MLARPLRILGWVGYAGLMLVIVIIAGYLSFSWFVRSGVTTVPDLVGASASQTESTLADHGLRLRQQEEARYDAEISAGHVLKQRPAPGSLVKRGSELEVILSLGPELVEVPDVRGQALQAAQVNLTAAGLQVGRTSGVFDSTALPGVVVEQDPMPGRLTGRAAEVGLYVCQESRLQRYLMPDLAYRDYDAVRGFFERRGFRLGSVRFEPYEGIAGGIVLRQFPLPGHPLRRQDVISLVVTADEPRGV